MTPRYAIERRSDDAPSDDRDLQLMSTLADGSEAARRATRKHRIEQLRDVDPYGPDSPDSWLIDSANMAGKGVAPGDAQERISRHRSASEQRAVSTTLLGGLLPATIPPYVAEAVAYGVRSTAPLAAAMLRLDLPPVGMSVAWTKVTTGATVTNQTAENTAVTASADVVAASTTDPLGTIAADLPFSAQSLDRSGGWFDRLSGEEMGRAYGARLEQQIWAGTGTNQQLKGLSVMSGNSSSTVSGQTMPLFMNKVYDQFQQVATNLGQVPDVVALAPRRYAMLGAAAAAFGLDATDLIPDDLTPVVSPAAPLTLGGGTEDWAVVFRRDAVPLVAEDPKIQFQREGPGSGPTIQFRRLVYSFAALGVSRRPEGVGLVKGLTPVTFA
jgi:hypothetical protein